MFISRRLRKDNIAEYLLYMWQVEDIIRAYGCSLTTLRRDYISQFDYDEGKREELTDWYGDLIRMINQEGCREKGHLQINKVVMMQLTDLHRQLLESPKFPFYTSVFIQSCSVCIASRRCISRPSCPLQPVTSIFIFNMSITVCYSICSIAKVQSFLPVFLVIVREHSYERRYLLYGI